MSNVFKQKKSVLLIKFTLILALRKKVNQKVVDL